MRSLMDLLELADKIVLSAPVALLKEAVTISSVPDIH